MPPAPPDPDEEPPVTSAFPPDAGFTVSTGATTDQPASAGAAVTFTDASDVHGASATYSWNFGDGSTGTGTSVQHTFATPGRYTVRLTVRNDRAQEAATTLIVYVRAPGSKTSTLSAETGGDVPCPGAAETITVDVHVRVPSWAGFPITVGHTVPAGQCPGVTVSNARAVALAAGNVGNHLDAWGRAESTISWEFDISNGGGTGSTNPTVTAAWG